MQQQQQINLPGEMYLLHPVAAPHSNIVHYHQLSPSMSQINQASLQQMPQHGIGKSSESGALERGIDCNPNRRDTFTAGALNTNLGQSQMQKQQQINHLGEMYLPHSGTAPHSNIVHYHPVIPSLQINQSLLQYLPQRGIGKSSESRGLERGIDCNPNQKDTFTAGALNTNLGNLKCSSNNKLII
jgi:hypothetical protein